MADTKHKLKKYKQYLETNPDGDKVLSVLNKLDALPVSISLLQDTGIGKLVNGFKKKPDGIGTVAKSIVNKWKNLVAEEANKATKLDSDDDQEYVPEPPKNVKYEASYNPTSKSQSDDEYCPQHVAEEYTPEEVKYKPAHRAVNKYAKYSNEKYSPQHTSSHTSSKQKYVPTKIPSAENSENESYSPSRINDDPLPYSPQHLSDQSEEEAYDQATPEQNASEPDEYDPTNNDASPTGASYTPTPRYENEQRHKSSSAKSDKHSSKSAKSSHSDGHKSKNGSLHSSSKSEKHSSSKHEKHSSNGKSERHSSKHKSHDEKHDKSDKHSSKHSDNEKHSKSQNGSHRSKSKDIVPNGKHQSSSSSHSSKDKKTSSSSVKVSSSSEKKFSDRSSSSKSSEKNSSHSDRKNNSVISESPSKSKLDKNRNEKRKISKIEPIDSSFNLFSPDDSAVVKRVKVESKPKVDSSSKSSKESHHEAKDSHKHSKHHSSSSSSSKPKDERLDKKDSSSKSTKHPEKRLDKHDKHSKSKSSSSSKGEKRKVKVEESLDDDATDGFSFDDFLNCDVKVPKKKMKKDPGSSGSPWSSSLSVSKPSTSKTATRVTDDSGFTVPKPSKQRLDIDESDILSLLPETSATYRPLPTRSLEDERKHSLATFDPMVIGTKQGKRTQVYSGRKHGLTEMKSLFSQCIQVLMDNIDAIDYVGGVPYDILKPVLERCSVQQLLRLEDLNPHFVGEDEELWAVHCEKEFKNQEPDEMESWREFYLRSVEEREERLEKLRMNMNKLQAAKPKSRQVQLAYVDNYVKPPREVLRKQQRYGTGKVVSASNSIQSTSRGGRANFSHNISVPQPKAVRPVAPMMQKINKMLAKRRR
ncbi:hypothetical protein LOTGIDRAFT_171838 [Lottia gigantea]|uniref:TFIIS N-terminal domain-containing protein n=1 Tax=Lottia gigantea TaxID=225164 RepID=V4BA31_LOTGI|nr:hypothetical protein LOTGIDRAFT_171838 [Lottia gigantea]ESP02637.1 hypothetical protein LOTGIDRAFT_171838 [Lottia gigantea]